MYRSAFEDFLIKAGRVRALIAQSNQVSLEAALLEMECARLAYSAARDALAQEYAPALPVPAVQAPDGGVRGLAELLWEVAGRPEGSAHQDWLRAEKIARRAAAARTLTVAAA